MNILVRLSPTLVYGDKLGLVELLGDRVGLSVSDINDIIISYFEYIRYNCVSSFNDREIVETCFMGDTMGHELLYAVTARFPEINAYIPDNATSVRYSRTLRDGFYLICEVPDEHSSNLRLDCVPAPYY